MSDVSALVAAAKAMQLHSGFEPEMWEGQSAESREWWLDHARVALDSRRPVQPPREALIDALHNIDTAASNAHVADALLAVPDLWQPAPEVDREAYEALYYEARRVVQALFPSAPTPGEVVRALERIGWHPTLPVSPRTVSTVEELDALPVGSVIRENPEPSHFFGIPTIPGVFEKFPEAVAGWHVVSGRGPRPVEEIALPASVLYVPSEGVES